MQKQKQKQKRKQKKKIYGDVMVSVGTQMSEKGEQTKATGRVGQCAWNGAQNKMGMTKHSRRS